MSELKTLRVCLSKELPPIKERYPSFIYFLYDKLELLMGQTVYSDPFAIVETMPAEPAVGVLYITLNDGNIKIYLDYSVKTIAEIENSEQLELLKQCGTTFFLSSDRRYLDLHRRVVTLPFNNGTYELTVSLAKDLVIDEDTVIGYNPATSQFEIIGKHNEFDLVFADKYRGLDTNTVDIHVTENKISADVKVSKAYDNIIKTLPDGLYASNSGKVTQKSFDNWVNSFSKYKLEMDTYISDLNSKVEKIDKVGVSKESIGDKIARAIGEVVPEINDAIAKYESIAARFEGIETRCKEYTTERFTEVKTEFEKFIDESSENPWGSF